MPKEIKDIDMKTFLLYLRGDEKNNVKNQCPCCRQKIPPLEN